MRKIICFDMFNTFIQIRGYDTDDELHYYSDVIHSPTWEPLNFPEAWEDLPAFPEAEEALAKLSDRYVLATASNCPVALQEVILKNTGLRDYFSKLVDFAKYYIYKPHSAAYPVIPVEVNALPDEITMVTANKTFGDLEGASLVGMEGILIRDDERPSLLDLLGSQDD